MSKNKKKKSSIQDDFWTKISDVMGGLEELSDHLVAPDITAEEVDMYMRASEFVGVVCGRAALFNALSDKGKDAVNMALQNMESFMMLASMRNKNIPVGIGETSLKNMEEMANFVYTPVAAKSFCSDLMKAKTDRIAAMNCILDLTIAAWEYGKGAEDEERDFCEHCQASQMAMELLPHIEGLLLPRVKARQLATSLESFANAPQLPQERREGLVNLAAQIREFAAIEDPPEDIENWDEILDDVAHIYACAKMETTALAVKGLLPLEGVARAFNVELEDIKELADGDGMKQFLDCVWKN